MACFYWSYSFLPLAESTALMFTMPLFLIALTTLFLGEKIGWRRTAATVAGFLGVVIMLRPGYAAFDPAFLVPLAVGLADAETRLAGPQQRGQARTHHRMVVDDQQVGTVFHGGAEGIKRRVPRTPTVEGPFALAVTIAP